MAATGAAQFPAGGFAAHMLETWEKGQPEYLAHEVMNQAWRPEFHSDVARALSDAKLEFVASADMIENFREMSLSEEQRALQDRFDDPVMRELIGDMCVARAFRNDVYVRGPRRLGIAARDDALGDIMIQRTHMRDSLPAQIDTPAGTADLDPEYWGTIWKALEDGPRHVRDILAIPALAGRKQNPAEVIGMLVGTRQAMAVVAAPEAPFETVLQFNRTIARHRFQPELLQSATAMASSGTGAALPCVGLELQLATRVAERGVPEDPLAMGREIVPWAGEEDMPKVAAGVSASLAGRLAVWKQFGIL